MVENPWHAKEKSGHEHDKHDNHPKQNLPQVVKMPPKRFVVRRVAIRHLLFFFLFPVFGRLHRLVDFFFLLGFP